MKRLIAGIVAGIVLGTASTASAYRIFYTGGGITCAKTGSGVVACIRSDGSGYGVAISRQAILVSHNGRTVFQRYQP